MRKELNYLELIEKYLSGALSNEEKAAFEQKMAASEQLQKDVQLQKELMSGIRQYKAKQEISAAAKHYKFLKTVKTIAITGITLAVLATAAYFISKSNEDVENTKHEQSSSIVTDENITSGNIYTIETAKDTVIESENGVVVAIPANAFTYEDGSLVEGSVDLELEDALNSADIIKAGLSTTSNGELLETGGMFKIKAFKDGKNLVLANDKSLHVDVPTDSIDYEMQHYRGEEDKNGNVNWVDPKPIIQDLPTVDITSLNFYPGGYLPKLHEIGEDTYDKSFTDSLYYSFSGEFGDESENESVVIHHISGGDTTFSRQSFKHNRLYSNNAECDQMNTFYTDVKYNQSDGVFIVTLGCRNKYENSLIVAGSDDGKLGIKITIKQSKLYTIAQDFALVASNGDTIKYVNLNNERIIAKLFTGDFKYQAKIKPLTNETIFLSGQVKYNATLQNSILFKNIDISLFTPLKQNISISNNRINPSKIKAIWQDTYNNTLLATKAFEERIAVIHDNCSSPALDMYVNNLEANMYENDERAYKITGDKRFKVFAERKQGKVRISSSLTKKLANFYKRKQDIYTKALAKTQKEFWDKQAKMDNKRNNASSEQIQKDNERWTENFKDEFEINVTEVYKQLGIPKPKVVWVPAYYSVEVNNLGWHNIDQEVFESTLARTSGTYTYKGKTAKLEYTPINVVVNGTYEDVKAYLLPSDLYSFQRMQPSGNTFSEKLNGFLIYDLLVIGMKDGKNFYYKGESISAKSYTVDLSEISNKQLDEILASYDSRKAKDIKDDMAFNAFILKDNIRVKSNQNRRELADKVRPVVFPCDVEGGDIDYGYESNTHEAKVDSLSAYF